MRARDVNYSSLATVCLGLALLGASCNSSGSGNVLTGTPTVASANNPTPTPTPAPTGVTPVGTVSTAGFYAVPVIPTGINYYFHEQSSLTASCLVNTNESVLAKKDIYCILDMPELDLYDNQIGFNFNAPNDMCAYTEIVPYVFYAYPAGVHTGYSNETVNSATGAVTIDPAHDPLNASGQPLCPYDYTSIQGPNCCEGTWSMDVTTTATASTPATTMHTTGSYSGKIAACLVGPGMNAPMKLDVNGFPESTIFRQLTTGQNFEFDIQSPISQQQGSNLYIANYFNPTSYGASQSTFPPETYGGTVPPPIYNKRAYYEYRCLDPADEIQARIRILIRSWDTVANFTAVTNPYTAPATLNPQFNDPLHDFAVWQDLVSGVVGVGGYIFGPL